jgi:hypothetical protein
MSEKEPRTKFSIGVRLRSGFHDLALFSPTAAKFHGRLIFERSGSQRQDKFYLLISISHIIGCVLTKGRAVSRASNQAHPIPRFTVSLLFTPLGGYSRVLFRFLSPWNAGTPWVFEYVCGPTKPFGKHLSSQARVFLSFVRAQPLPNREGRRAQVPLV